MTQQRTCVDSLGGEQHHGGQTHAEYELLSEVQKRQRLVRLQVGILVFGQHLIVPVHLELLVVEVLSVN